MSGKIKVNLSEASYNAALNDMIKFEFFRKNGDVNRNDFFNTVITNMYTNNIYRRKDFKKLLGKEEVFNSISNNDRENFIDAAAKVMNNYYYEDSNEYHQYSFTIYPTKVTQRIFDIISARELNNKGGSAFLRSIISEYLSLSQADRERVVRQDMYQELCSICETQHSVICYVSGHKLKLVPYALVPSREQTGYYLLSIDLDSIDKNPVSIRLAKIKRITPLDDYYEFSDEELKKLNEIIKKGVQYASGDILKVRISLTDKGKRLLNFKIYNKPSITKLDNDTFEVSCTISNFLNYFYQYGKETQILDNDELKEKMRIFYKQAYEAFC